jgi:MoaA/NifB/PqqE/SkfB family radical SAM enzyme
VNGPRPTVSWNVVGGCNYRCTYCVQKHMPGSGAPSDAELDAALDTLAALEGSWELKISGGEPFLLRRLPEVARRIAAAGHRVSVLTNLSAPLSEITEFIAAAGPQLRTFSCSLHREYTSDAEFLEKALAVQAALAPYPRATFVVNAVVVPGAVESLARTRRDFEGRGVKFYPQLMRVNGKPHAYDAGDLRAIDDGFGDLVSPAQMNRGYSFTGRLCHAGSKYFIIHPRGDAFRCYPGKRAGDAWLGNVFDGTFRLWSEARPCPYDVCPCTVPQNRGIVTGFQGDRASPAFE